MDNIYLTFTLLKIFVEVDIFLLICNTLLIQINLVLFHVQSLYNYVKNILLIKHLYCNQQYNQSFCNINNNMIV